MGSCLVLDRQEELEFRRKLLLGVEPIRKVNPSNPAVCVNLHPQGLDVVRSVRPPREVGQVELDLVPPFVKSHWHCTNERFHSRCGLVVGGPKSAAHVLVIKHLHFEAKILLEILDDHDKEGKLDAQGPAKGEEREHGEERGSHAMSVDSWFHTKAGRRRSFPASCTYMAGSAGHVMYIVLTFVPMISRTDDWMSPSVILLMCPLRTA